MSDTHIGSECIVPGNKEGLYCLNRLQYFTWYQPNQICLDPDSQGMPCICEVGGFALTASDHRFDPIKR